MTERDRLHWRCRRGTRELDLMLMRYLNESYPHADAVEQAMFERLLELPDPELQELLFGDSEAADAGIKTLVQRMRESRPRMR